jgi:DNA-binding IclR family transcriptional regulator
MPRYWELAAECRGGLDAAVDRCVLDPLGPLHREPDRLLQEEMPPAVSLRPILDVIGMGAHRLSEIAGRVGQPATSLARPLGRLVDLGLVQRERPYGEPEKGGKRAIYRIADPFVRMWFRVVAPHRAQLAQAPAEARLQLWREAREALFAEAWEDLCRLSVARLNGARPKSSLARLGPWRPASRCWLASEAEWDVVAHSGDGRRLLVGEAKWSAQPATAAGLRAIAAELAAKGAPPVAKHDEEVVRAVFVPRVAKGTETPEGCHLVGAAEVLAALE